jgi:RNA polymerase sigma-70 factor (ECF subfamily)
MELAEEERLRDAVAGSEQALAALLNLHAPALRRVISTKLPAHLQPVLSEDDVLQQTFADAWRDIKTFDPSAAGSFLNWLKSLAACNLQDAIRSLEAKKRGGKRKKVDLPDSSKSHAELFDFLVGTGSSPGTRAAAHEIDRLLKDAIARLPEAYRAVVQMHDLDGHDVADVAAALQRSAGAVYMLRARAHDQLRKMLGDSTHFFTRFA